MYIRLSTNTHWNSTADLQTFWGWQHDLARLKTQLGLQTVTKACWITKQIKFWTTSETFLSSDSFLKNVSVENACRKLLATCHTYCKYPHHVSPLVASCLLKPKSGSKNEVKWHQEPWTLQVVLLGLFVFPTNRSFPKREESGTASKTIPCARCANMLFLLKQKKR